MRMTREEAAMMLRAKLECMTRDVSGSDEHCNRKLCDDCDLCYAQGNMGEQKECLRMAIEALEQESILAKEKCYVANDINAIADFYNRCKEV